MNDRLPSSGPLRRRGLSLEHKLPLAVSALLVIVLIMYGWIAYRDVSRSTLLAAAERDTRLAADLGRVLSQTSAARSIFVARIANRPAVQRALLGGPVEPATAVLDTLRVPSDPEFTVVLLDSAQRPVHIIGPPPTSEVARRLDSALEIARQRDTLAGSAPFFINGKRAQFWSAAVVRAGGRRIGYVAHLRTMASTPGTARLVQSLVGAESRMVFSSTAAPNGPMVTLSGEVLPAPTKLRREGGVERYQRGGAQYIAGRDTLPGTPFELVVETPLALADAHAMQFLRRTGLIGLALLLGGTLAIWLVSRRFTKPIRDLSDATEALAARDYDQHVDADRTDELGVLAHNFNRMAGEIRDAVREAEASRQVAELANRAKSEFLGNMSHEIRTPINAMIGYADLLEMGVAGPITDEQRVQLERIRVSGKHLIGLIDDLLDFARIETARLTIAQQIAPASAAIDTAVTVVDPQASAKPVSLTSAVEPDSQYIGDPQRVEQILVNLLGNAVKFTPAGGSVHVACRTVRGNGLGPHTEFTVLDTGIGIAPERLESVFEPFVQAHSGYTRPHGGSGLGLTISRRLAELMGGNIAVQSQEGVGSRFTLTLPAPRGP